MLDACNLARLMSVPVCYRHRYASHMLVPQHALQREEVQEAFGCGKEEHRQRVANEEEESGPDLSRRIIAAFEQPVDGEYHVSLWN